MKKVLLVDDSQIARWNVKQHFEETGYEVLEASNGQEALDMAGAHPELSLIMLDYTMPGMNGITVARKLRERNNNVPIAFLSAQASEALKKEAKEVSAICWALKSTAPKDLVKIVDKYLSTKAS